MLRVFVLSFGCLLLLGSCTQKLICPAYQSAFIHDQDALRKKFSYFKEDSTPKLVTVSKNKYLIIPEQSYRKKIKSMKTVEMKTVKVTLPDSLQPKYNKDKTKESEFKGAEQDAGDSTAIKNGVADSAAQKKQEAPEDSAYAITKDKEMRVLKYDRDSAKYRVVHITLNADQDNYMWYFRDVLVLPDVRAALDDQKKAKAAAAEAAKPKKDKKGFLGFFKNLFKKKEKVDSTKTVAPSVPPIDSDNPADSTAALSVALEKPAPAPEKKKGLFGLFKKKKPKTEKKEPEPIAPQQPADDKKEPDKKDVKKEGEGF
jgi:hypothetical protein